MQPSQFVSRSKHLKRRAKIPITREALFKSFDGLTVGSKSYQRVSVGRPTMVNVWIKRIEPIGKFRILNGGLIVP